MREPLNLTLMQALDIQGACIFAAHHYQQAANLYEPGEDLRGYFEGRAKRFFEIAEWLRAWIICAPSHELAPPSGICPNCGKPRENKNG